MTLIILTAAFIYFLGYLITAAWLAFELSKDIGGISYADGKNIGSLSLHWPALIPMYIAAHFGMEIHIKNCPHHNRTERPQEEQGSGTPW